MPPFETLPIYYLFYKNDFDAALAGKFYHKNNEMLINSIDNIRFISDWCPTKFINRLKLSRNSLVVENGDCVSASGYRQIASFTRHDITCAFKLLIPD